MVEHSRYSVGGEDGKEVLRNKLRITDQETLNDAETILLSDTYDHFLALSESGSLQFDVDLIFRIHRYFLGPLYSWAGKIRIVEISKNGMLFCASLQIKNALNDLEKTIEENIPSNKDNRRMISEKLARIHCEFNAIHPFREGNGRTIRLFLDLLMLNNGFSLLDYGKFGKSEYLEACIKGMSKDYGKMSKILYKAIT